VTPITTESIRNALDPLENIEEFYNIPLTSIRVAANSIYAFRRSFSQELSLKQIFLECGHQVRAYVKYTLVRAEKGGLLEISEGDMVTSGFACKVSTKRYALTEEGIELAKYISKKMSSFNSY